MQSYTARIPFSTNAECAVYLKVSFRNTIVNVLCMFKESHFAKVNWNTKTYTISSLEVLEEQFL